MSELLKIALLAQLGIPNLPLPKADCPNCNHRVDPSGKADCYMFKQKPGDYCGQFQAKKPTTPVNPAKDME